jgi:hypothetical protein
MKARKEGKKEKFWSYKDRSCDNDDDDDDGEDDGDVFACMRSTSCLSAFALAL